MDEISALMNLIALGAGFGFFLGVFVTCLFAYMVHCVQQKRKKFKAKLCEDCKELFQEYTEDN